MIGLMPKTNCSSSVVALFGWSTSGRLSHRIASHVQESYPQDEAFFGVYKGDGDIVIAIAREGEEVAIGHRGSFCASEQFVSELVSSVLRILRDALGELVVKQYKGDGYMWLLQNGEIGISPPGLVIFDAGNEGRGLLGVVYGVRSMQIDDAPPLPDIAVPA